MVGVGILRVRAADQEGVEPLRGILGRPEGDLAAVLVAEAVGPRDSELIEHRGRIAHPEIHAVGLRCMRLVAASVPAGIDPDEPVVVAQCVHPPQEVELLTGPAEPMKKDHGPAAALDAVMDSDIPMTSVGRGTSLPPRQGRAAAYAFSLLARLRAAGKGKGSGARNGPRKRLESSPADLPQPRSRRGWTGWGVNPPSLVDRSVFMEELRRDRRPWSREDLPQLEGAAVPPALASRCAADFGQPKI